MSFGKQFVEKRQYERRDYYCLIKYRRLDEKSDYGETVASLRNISGGGALFRSKDYLPLDCRLQMKINFSAIGRVIEAVAKVARFEEIKKSQGYGVGVVFSDIKPEDKIDIINFATPNKFK